MSKATSTPPPEMRRIFVDGVRPRRRRPRRSRRAWWRKRACRADVSTATICRAPASFAPRTALNPTPPRPTTATDWPGSTLAVLTTAPTPVSTAQPNSAASSRGKAGIDLDEGFARHNGVVGEGRDAQKMIDRLGAERKPPFARKQRSRDVRLGPRLAERRAAGRARAAAAAARHKDQHDVVAGFQVGRRPRPTPRRSPPPRDRAPSATGGAASRRSPTGRNGRGQPP